MSHTFVAQIERSTAKTHQNQELCERMASAYGADVREVMEAASARYVVSDDQLVSARERMREMLVRLLSHPTAGLWEFHPNRMATLSNFWAERIFQLAQRVETHARVGGDPVRDILKGEAGGAP